MAGAGDAIDPRAWAARAAWFDHTLETARGKGAAPLELGDHAQALMVEVETCFCAGAWLATVILACAVVEAQIRESGHDGHHAMTRIDQLFEDAGLLEEVDWLRRRRNQLLHRGDTPVLSVDMHWFQADALEDDARAAVALMADAVYGVAVRRP